MIYWIAGAYAVALLAWLAVVEVGRWRRRKRLRERLKEECGQRDFDMRR